MKERKGVLRTIFAILLTALIVGALLCAVFIKFPADSKIQSQHLIFGSVCACFLYAMLLSKIDAKKLFLILALALNAVAVYFLIVKTTASDNDLQIGLYIMCAAQVAFLVYTLMLNKSIGLKIVNIAVRVALCLCVYYILPNYFTLKTYEMISVMYLANSLVTLLALLCYAKSQWPLLIAYLLLFACEILFVYLKVGAQILPTPELTTFLDKYDMPLYCYVPGLLLVATFSVWKQEEN